MISHTRSIRNIKTHLGKLRIQKENVYRSFESEQVYQRVCDPEFISLKQDIAVCKGQAVECMATRVFCDGGVNKMEVWIGSGASDWTDRKNNNEKSTHTSQLSRIDLTSSKRKVSIPSPRNKAVSI